MVDESGLRCCEHRGLPPSVGMAAEEDAARSLPAHGRNRRSESLLVALRAAALRRPVRARLAEGKVAAQDSPSRRAESVRQGDEERGVAVRSGAVGQDEAIPGGSGREMQEAANGHFVRRSVHEFEIVVHAWEDAASPGRCAV